MAATRIVVLLTLKSGKSAADYEDWARTTDLPTVNALASVERFSIHAATGLLGSTAPSPYDYVEILDVADMEAFSQDVATETMGRVAAEFQAWADPIFIVTRDIAA